MELAQEQGVPPYIIFHDSTLIEMHLQKPLTLNQFAMLSGVGQSKLQRYGLAFLEVISLYESHTEPLEIF